VTAGSGSRKSRVNVSIAPERSGNSDYQKNEIERNDDCCYSSNNPDFFDPCSAFSGVIPDAIQSM